MEILRAVSQEQYIYVDLVDAYSVPVYRFCRSLTYSKEDAEDLFQETFLKVFEQMQKINNSGNPQSFLFSTSLYIWKSWKRKYARRKRLAPDSPMDEAIPSEFSIEEDILEKEETRIVREVVETLPEKFKIPIILYYTMELNINDIALTLKLPPGTIKSRLFKARKLIAEGLEAIDYEK